jgi:hypothetical protein
MAVVINGVANAMPSDKFPVGYTPPTVSQFTDYEYVRQLKLNVLKTTVENGTPTTTLGNIFTNPTIGLVKQITDIVTLDYINTLSVTAFGVLTELRVNVEPEEVNFTYLKNTTTSYVAYVTLYVKTV